MSKVILRLYVTSSTPAAAQAISTLSDLCLELRNSQATLDVIDVLKDPEAALNDDAYATPIAFRIKPEPVRRVFGNLSSKEMLTVDLQLISIDEED